MNNPKAVIGTNSWGSAAYEKIIRGNVVDNDTLKAAMKAAVKSNLLFVDSARDYGFGKGPKLIGMCCPDKIKISSKYTRAGTGGGEQRFKGFWPDKDRGVLASYAQ